MANRYVQRNRKLRIGLSETTARIGSNSFVGFSLSAEFGVVILMNDAADYGQSLTALGMRTLRSAMKPDESADESGVASAGE